MTEQIVLEIKNLSKYYGKLLAVNNVNITVKEGTVYGFLGPNGAGKTTTIRVILSILKPSSGAVKLFGIPVDRSNVQIHNRIGYIPGDVALYGHLTVKQMLDYFASLRSNRPSSRMEEMVELFDLDITKNTKTLSRGNRQKVAIVQAFMHDPDFYIFDEPSSGLDPLMQQVLYDLITEEVEKGKTFFISSHYLGEIQKIADKVSIIREGEIISTMDVSKLDQQVIQKVHIDFQSEVNPSLLQDPNITVLSQDKNELILIVKGDFHTFLEKISKFPIERFYAPEPSLEDYFMHFYDLKNRSGGK
jgi:ABC-2 type transport system ATP-binding protein